MVQIKTVQCINDNQIMPFLFLPVVYPTIELMNTGWKHIHMHNWHHFQQDSSTSQIFPPHAFQLSAENSLSTISWFTHPSHSPGTFPCIAGNATCIFTSHLSLPFRDHHNSSSWGRGFLASIETCTALIVPGVAASTLARLSEETLMLFANLMELPDTRSVNSPSHPHTDLSAVGLLCCQHEATCRTANHILPGWLTTNGMNIEQNQVNPTILLLFLPVLSPTDPVPSSHLPSFPTPGHPFSFYSPLIPFHALSIPPVLLFTHHLPFVFGILLFPFHLEPLSLSPPIWDHALQMYPPLTCQFCLFLYPCLYQIYFVDG